MGGGGVAASLDGQHGGHCGVANPLCRVGERERGREGGGGIYEGRAKRLGVDIGSDWTGLGILEMGCEVRI